MAALRIQRWDPARDGEFSEIALRRKLESLGYTCCIYRYEPGTFFDDHAHAVDKIDAVLSGRFRIGSGAEIVILGTGEYVHIPAGLVHFAEVVGEEPVLSLDAIRT
ncbi:MAG TPA: cupin domain-containing protein [Gammaproteobacteria bacterium]|nr:cupin domain-containing protein [Gammaproteobacteria bacterium]